MKKKVGIQTNVFSNGSYFKDLNKGVLFAEFWLGASSVYQLSAFCPSLTQDKRIRTLSEVMSKNSQTFIQNMRDWSAFYTYYIS